MCLYVPGFQRQVLKYVLKCKWIPQTKVQWIPHTYTCNVNFGFRKFAYFWSDFERYNDLGMCLWNPKQHRRSKKSSNVADSATNLILVCCGFRLQCRECTVWPRNELYSNGWKRPKLDGVGLNIRRIPRLQNKQCFFYSIFLI